MDTTTGRHISNFQYFGMINSIAFNPDGTMLASGGVDDIIRLWDVGTGDLLRMLRGHRSNVNSIVFSPDGSILASGSDDDTIRLWDVATRALKQTLREHWHYVNSIAFSPDRLMLASGSDDNTIFNQEVSVEGNPADVNEDDVINIVDLVKVAAAIGMGAAAAPAAFSQNIDVLPRIEDVQEWLSKAQLLDLTDASSERGIHFLEQLLAALTPERTSLLPNYPNPFNPETWIPYQLAQPSSVTISIYAVDGKLIRTLDLGFQPVGIYQHKNHAAHWDGKNNLGEPVSSGVYYYTLKAGKFTSTGKMLIMK